MTGSLVVIRRLLVAFDFAAATDAHEKDIAFVTT